MVLTERQVGDLLAAVRAGHTDFLLELGITRGDYFGALRRSPELRAAVAAAAREAEHTAPANPVLTASQRRDLLEALRSGARLPDAAQAAGTTPAEVYAARRADPALDREVVAAARTSGRRRGGGPHLLH